MSISARFEAWPSDPSSLFRFGFTVRPCRFSSPVVSWILELLIEEFGVDDVAAEPSESLVEDSALGYGGPSSFQSPISFFAWLLRPWKWSSMWLNRSVQACIPSFLISIISSQNPHQKRASQFRPTRHVSSFTSKVAWSLIWCHVPRCCLNNSLRWMTFPQVSEGPSLCFSSHLQCSNIKCWLFSWRFQSFLLPNFLLQSGKVHPYGFKCRFSCFLDDG